MTRLIGVFAAAAAVVFVSGAAAQQPQCPLSRAEILSTALTKFNEGPVQHGGAIGSDGLPYLFELLLSTEGSWTFTRTGADGQTCVMATGTGWATTGEPPPVGDPT